MPLLRLLARLGQHKAGDLIEYGKAEATYLVDAGKAERVKATVHSPVAEPDEQQPTTVQPEAQRDADEDQEQSAEHDDEHTAPALTLNDLKAQAEALGLPTSGTKAQLADRIQQHHDRQQSDNHEE